MAGRRIGRRISIVAILFLMIFGFGGNPTFAAGKPYKIGLILAITGSYSSLGEPQKRAVTLIQEEVNKRGGIKGNRLELVIIDSQSDPSKAVMGLKSLLRDPEVCGLVGGTSTADNLVLIPVVEKEEITFFSGGGSVEISDPVKRYVFQLPTTDRVAMRDILNYLRKRNLTQLAMIHSTGGWGMSGAERLREQAPRAGFTVLGYESFGDKDVDMTSQLVRIRDLNPQVIISWTATTAGAIISKNIVQLGIKALHVHDHGFGNIKYVKVAGDAANGNIVPLGKILVAEQQDPSDPEKKNMLEFKQKYESTWNEPVTNFAAYMADGVMMLKKALEAVGPDRSKIRDYIENLRNFVGYYRMYSFSPNDHGKDASALVMVKVVDQNWRLIKD